MRYLLLTILTIIYLTPTSVVAQTYDDSILRAERGLGTPTYDTTARPDFVPLVNIPFLNELQIEQENLGLAGYANSLYRAAITIAAVLAVIKIVMAGVQYMLTDVVPQKSDAKKNIKNALLGLTIVIGAVLILNTINPSLTNLEVLNLKQLAGDVGNNTIPTGERIAGSSDRLQEGETISFIGLLFEIKSEEECIEKGGRVIEQNRCIYPDIPDSIFYTRNINEMSNEELSFYRNDCDSKGGSWDELTAGLVRCTYPPGISPSIYTDSDSTVADSMIRDAQSERINLFDESGKPFVCGRKDPERRSCIQKCYEQGGTYEVASQLCNYIE